MERNKKNSTSWKFRTVQALMQETKTENSPMENLFTSRIFSIPTVIKEIKPVFLVKYELEYR